MVKMSELHGVDLAIMQYLASCFTDTSTGDQLIDFSVVVSGDGTITARMETVLTKHQARELRPLLAQERHRDRITSATPTETSVCAVPDCPTCRTIEMRQCGTWASLDDETGGMIDVRCELDIGHDGSHQDGDWGWTS